MPDPSDSAAPIIRIAENSVPEGITAEYLRADDGARLRVMFLPTPNARATVVVHPGWAEFAEKYFEVARELQARHFNVVVCDPRGQGYSQRYARGDSRGLVTDFSRFRADLDTVFSEAETRFSGPMLILAHSMGGLISLDWLAAGGHKRVAGVVLCAPLTRLFSSRGRRILIRNIARWGTVFGGASRHIPAAPDQSMDFETNKLTQDPRRHERFRLLQVTAPEAHAGAPRFGWLNAAQMTMMRLGRPGGLASIELPILIVSADNDETVDPTHHRELGAQYEMIQVVRVADARHEILMERDDYRNQLWRAFDRYVADRLDAVRANAPPTVSSTSPSSVKSRSASAT